MHYPNHSVDDIGSILYILIEQLSVTYSIRDVCEAIHASIDWVNSLVSVSE